MEIPDHRHRWHPKSAHKMGVCSTVKYGLYTEMKGARHCAQSAGEAVPTLEFWSTDVSVFFTS